ncbi:hypothetical protein PN836_011330 [Ningiella sp. W23]|uniref:hypothetical protein n=1 Tax=Ningiella sp. W23 TaxID=3023715 RepID=UPI003756ADE0
MKQLAYCILVALAAGVAHADDTSKLKIQSDDDVAKSISVKKLDNCQWNLSRVDTSSEVTFLDSAEYKASDIPEAFFDDRFCMYQVDTYPSSLETYTSNPNYAIHFRKTSTEFFDVLERYREKFSTYSTIENQAAFTRVFLNRLTKEFAVKPAVSENANKFSISVYYRSSHNGQFSEQLMSLEGFENPALAAEFDRQVLKVQRRAVRPQIHLDMAYIFNGKVVENKFLESMGEDLLKKAFSSNQS